MKSDVLSVLTRESKMRHHIFLSMHQISYWLVLKIISDTLAEKFAIKRSLNVPSQLKRVATLLCEMTAFKICTVRSHGNDRSCAHALRIVWPSYRWIFTISQEDQLQIYYSRNSRLLKYTDHVFTAMLVWKDTCWRSDWAVSNTRLIFSKQS